MSGSMHFIDAVPGKSDVEKQTAQRALIRSQAMRHYRRQQRKTDIQQHAATIVASCNDSLCVPDTLTSHDQVAGSLGDCAECLSHGRLHHIQTQDEEHRNRMSPPKAKHCMVSCVTPDSSRCVAETPDSIVSSHDHQDEGMHSLRREKATIPLEIFSPATWRQAFVVSFAQNFFPSQEWTSPVLFARLAQWGGGKNLSMQHINDALAMMQSGVALQNRCMLIEGQQRHVLAVRSLRAEICRPGVSIEKISCAAINIMGCELYTATTSGLNGCVIHIAGVTAILQAHSRQSNAEPLTPRLRRNFHRLILMHHLITAKTISISDRVLGVDTEVTPGSVEALMQLCSRLPGVMEATSYQFDRVFDEGPSSEVQTLHILTSSLAEEFDKWLQAYESPGFRYRRAPLQFHSFVDANMLGLYWSARLLLAKCGDQLLMMQSLNPPCDVDDIQCHKKEADMYATYLLEAAMAIDRYEGTTLSKAFAIRAPLHFARGWWNFSADKTRLEETLNLEGRLQSDLPGIDWDTLLYWSFLPLMWLV